MRNLLPTLLAVGLGVGCGSPPTPGVVAPTTPVAPNSAAPDSTARVAPSTAPAAAPISVAPPPAPRYECAVFVMGDPKSAFKAAIEDRQFKQRVTTTSEISMYAKVLQGDEMKRIALCDAFAKRKCPEAWHGDDTHCRMQMTVDVEAEWGSASPVPK